MMTEAEVAAIRERSANGYRIDTDTMAAFRHAVTDVQRLQRHTDALTTALAAERARVAALVAAGDDLAGSVRLLAEIERTQISNGPGGTYGVVKIKDGAVLLYSDMRDVANECLARWRAARKEPPDGT